MTACFRSLFRTALRQSLLMVALLALVAGIAPIPAAAQGVQVDKSEIRFVSKQMGVNVEGRFRKWTANVIFAPNDLAHAKADFDIELASIDLASTESESEVAGAPWFNAAKFPIAHFASTSIKSVGPDKYEFAGTLAIKGVTRNVVVPVTLRKDAAGNSVAEGTFTVKRLEYKIGEGEWADPSTVADDVAVRVRMVLAPPR
jgi:polyisoprenoid-binding protein YceI